MQYVQGQNYFPPLTPEQEAQLRRDAISTEVYSPLDFIGGGLIGGAAGRIGQHMAGAAGQVPWWQSLMINGGLAGITGGAAGLAGPAARREMNTIRDAEGQPGGFYGNMPPRR